jgi:DNA polymerase-1
LFPDYQGQRGPLGGVDAANFAWQVDEANKLLGRIGIRAVTAPGFEADDIVGTLSAAADREGRSALIVSSDRDLQQLVTENVHVLIPGKKPLEIGPEDVHARLGIPPARIVDWKVLAGDPSDNIPGVPGIGDKSAVDLVTRFGDWRSVYEHVDELTTRQRAALAAGRAMAELFDDVVTVKCDLDLGVSWDDLRINQDELPERAGDALRLAGLRPEEE